MSSREDLEFLIQQVRDARAEQERINRQLERSGQGGTDPTNRGRQDAATSAAERTGQAEAALSAALPPNTDLADVLGYARAQPAGGTTQQPAPGQGATPTNASGTSGYLQRVLDANRLGNVGFRIQDNILNEYDRYTYKFGLYLVNDRDAEEPDIGTKIIRNQVRKYTVAESGVTTGFNIVDVEIIDHVNSSYRNRNNVTSDINITLTEPYGMTLVDRLYLASRELGVMNWRMAALFLTMEILAISADGVPLQDNRIQKVYKLLISDMNSQLTQVGSTYKITAAVNNSLGFRDQYYLIPSNIVVNIGGSSTPSSSPTQATPPPTPGNSTPPPSVTVRAAGGSVGEFFNAIGEALTKIYREARVNPSLSRTTPVVIYEFKVDPILAGEPINLSPSTNSRRRSWDSQGRAITVNRVGINELVDDILSSLTNADFFLVPGPTGALRVPRIECRVEHVGWDGLLNDYIKKFTYYIGIMETLRAVASPEHGEYFQANPPNQRARMEEVARQAIIKKVYPYYYTGMNTEIINLDVTFNQLHVIPLPLYNGRSVTPAQQGQSQQTTLSALENQRAQTNSTIARLQQRSQQVNQELIYLDRIIRSRGDTNTVADESFRSSINREAEEAARTGVPLTANRGLQPITDQAQRYRLQIAQNRQGLLQTETQTIATQLAEAQRQLPTFDSQIADLRSRGVYLFDPTLAASLPGLTVNRDPNVTALVEQAQRNREANQRLAGTKQFVEDVNINQLLDVNNPGTARLSYIADPRDIANNMARASNTQDLEANTVRGTYATILAQIYDRVGLQLTEIEMEIRGDPYWLGETNLERQQELIGYANGAQSFVSRIANDPDRQFANYHGRDAGFLLLFRPGNPPNEETGYMNFAANSVDNQSVFFNGAYLAIEVTHVFRDGKFTQKIRAQRDNLINLEAAARSNATQGAGTGQPSPAANAQPAANSPQQSAQQAAPATPVAPAPAGPVLDPGNDPGAVPNPSAAVQQPSILQAQTPNNPLTTPYSSPISPSRRGRDTRAQQQRLLQAIQSGQNPPVEDE